MVRWIKALDRVLRGEATRPTELRSGTMDVPLGGLSAVILVLGIIYGACMGVFAVITRWGTPEVWDGILQVISSAIKVPVLLLTLLVTFPSLYVFNALVGSRLSLSSLLRLLIAAMGVMMALLASFGTIVVFFSVSTESYPFMVLLNVVLFATSGFLGLGFLLQTLHRLAAVSMAAQVPVGPPDTIAPAAPPDSPLLGAETVSEGEFTTGSTLQPGPLERMRGQQEIQSVKAVFRIWVIVFGLVGAQMGWVLRPFVLHPRSDFVVLRERDSNFFQAVFQKIGDLFESDSRTKQLVRPQRSPRLVQPATGGPPRTYDGRRHGMTRHGHLPLNG